MCVAHVWCMCGVYTHCAFVSVMLPSFLCLMQLHIAKLCSENLFERVMTHLGCGVGFYSDIFAIN